MKKNGFKKLLLNCFTVMSALLIFISIHAEEKMKITVASRKVQLLKRVTGKEQGSPRNFGNPLTIFVDKQRNILYVAEAGGPVYRFDIANDYKFLDIIGETVKMKYILDVNVDKNGNIYVLDADRSEIYVFDNQTTLKQTLKVRDNRAGGSGLTCVSIAFSSKGDMYIGDKGGNGIQVLDWEGNYLYQIKKAKLDQLEFGFPSVATVRMNSQDEVFLFDNLIARIIKFNLKGKTLAVFGGRGDVAGKFIDAANITLDNKDRIYVVETMTGTIQVFDKEGNFLHILANENGERLLLLSPSSICLDESGKLLFVCERMNQRVSVYKFID